MSRKNKGNKTAASYKAPSAVFQASPQGMAREALKEELAKTGATLAPNGMKKQADGGAYFSIPMPFQPEFGDPSKLHFPIDRHQQNRYWRLINKTDPVIGSVIDMFAEMLCSDIDLYGEGINGEVKRQYEEMIQSTQIISMFQYFIKEFLIIGEVIPHLVFDETKGIWTDLLFHNPDQVNVMSAPFMNMEPILDFIPDESLKNFVQSKNPQVLEYLSNLPEDILSSILSSNSIPLNTQMNVSFIPRKLHPYDVRGTSIMPRLWQIYMYESAIMNASIATARRHAGPIKVLKVGDPQGNWLPTEADLTSMMEKLTMAEQDPHAWLTSHPFLNFEAWGTTDRMMSISREYDLIERVKLTALGVSQGFLHGECGLFDTPILTSDYTYKPIQDIEIGSSVIDKEGQPQIVTHAWESRTPETLTELELVGGETIQVTHNHKFPVWSWMRACGCGCGEEVKTGKLFKTGHQWKIAAKDRELLPPQGDGFPKRKKILKSYDPYQKLEASEIRKKDYLMMPRGFSEELSDDVTLDHAKLLGFYISEGCYTVAKADTHSNAVQWTFNIKEKSTYAKEVIDAGMSLDMEFSLDVNTKGSRCNVRSARKGYLPFYNWLLANGGRYSHLKKMSAEVMRWPLSYKKEVIRGMFKGDGSRGVYTKLDKRVNKEYTSYIVQYGTVSETLAKQTKILLAQLGIFIAIDRVKKPPVDKNGYVTRDAYNLRCYGTDAVKLAKLVWNEDVTLDYSTRQQTWCDDNYMYVPIRTIKTVENVENLPTFNLTVDNDHSYIMNGFGTYNSTYASSDVNMNTLLMRLRGLRKFFEGVWWRPKFFKPIAEINDWYHSTPAEISHRVKTKKTAHDQRLIIPKIKWRQSLEPVVDKDLLDAIRVLNDMGIKSSKGTAFAAAGLDFEGETTNNYVEQKIEKQIREKILPQEKEEHEKIEEEISLPGGGGAPLTPTAPEEGEGLDEVSPSPEEGEGEAGPDREQPTPETMEPAPASKRGFKISANDVEDLIDLMESGKTDSDIWSNLVGKKESPTKFRKNCDWVRILDYMEDEGYSNKEIEYTRKALVRKSIVEPELQDRIEAALDKVEQHALLGGEEQMGELLDNNIKKKIAKFTEATNKAAADTNADIDMLFAGEGNYKYTTNEFILKTGGNMSKDKIANYRKTKGGK